MAAGLAAGAEPSVVFTPHLVPMQRGELATVTGVLSGPSSTAAAREVLSDAYASSPFVSVIDSPPQTRWAVSSNRAIISAFVDEHAGVVISQAAIDNLVKGAAGGAMQWMNRLFGQPDAAGLNGIPPGWT